MWRDTAATTFRQYLLSGPQGRFCLWVCWMSLFCKLMCQWPANKQQWMRNATDRSKHQSQVRLKTWRLKLHLAMFWDKLTLTDKDKRCITTDNTGQMQRMHDLFIQMILKRERLDPFYTSFHMLINATPEAWRVFTMLTWIFYASMYRFYMCIQITAWWASIIAKGARKFDVVMFWSDMFI